MIEETTRKKWPSADSQRGLVCRNCACRHFNVIHTRPAPGSIMRERQCRNCGKVVRTWEKME